METLADGSVPRLSIATRSPTSSGSGDMDVSSTGTASSRYSSGGALMEWFDPSDRDRRPLPLAGILDAVMHDGGAWICAHPGGGARRVHRRDRARGLDE